MNNQNSIKITIFNTLLIIFISAVGTTLILYTQNTLYNNGNWDSGKIKLGKGVTGTVAFIVTPNALDKNSLNLGAWHGYHELIYKATVNPSFIAFDTLFEKPSEFSFIFNKNESGFSGIRINTQEKEGIIDFFISSSEGEFLNRKRLENNSIELNKWNNFKVQFKNDALLLDINNKRIGSYNLDILDNQLVGFRGGSNKVLIDNIVIADKNFSKEITESFDNKKGFWFIFGYLFLILLILNFFLSKLSKKRNSLYFCLMINLCLLTIVFIIYLYYYNFASENYITDENKIDWKGYTSNIEPQETVVTKIDNDYGNKKDNISRILFIGTSQTWGAGASSENKTFVRLFENLLNKNSQITNYEVINGGISGLNSKALLELYKSSWIKLSPDIVIIDLATNDFESNEFFNNLKNFISLNDLNYIKTSFILEPNNQNSARLLKNHQVMQKLARENDIKVIDMHSYLLKNYDKGFLWWDEVHLTDFGQELFADKLYDEINPFIPTP